MTWRPGDWIERENRALRGRLAPPELEESKAGFRITIHSIPEHPLGSRFGVLASLLIGLIWAGFSVFLLGMACILFFRNDLNGAFCHVFGALICTSVAWFTQRITWRLAHKEYGIWNVHVGETIRYERRALFWTFRHVIQRREIKCIEAFTQTDEYFCFGAEFFTPFRVIIHSGKQRFVLPVEDETAQIALTARLSSAVFGSLEASCPSTPLENDVHRIDR